MPVTAKLHKCKGRRGQTSVTLTLTALDIKLGLRWEHATLRFPDELGQRTVRGPFAQNFRFISQVNAALRHQGSSLKLCAMGLSSRRSQFRAFVECTGQLATHEVNSNRYLNPSFARQPCYAKHNASLYLCDHCLAFWCRCQEHHRLSAWQMALILRNLRERKRKRKKPSTKILTKAVA